MAKELADDWWNRNRNLVTGFRYADRHEVSKNKTLDDIMKYEMEPIKFKTKEQYNE